MDGIARGRRRRADAKLARGDATVRGAEVDDGRRDRRRQTNGEVILDRRDLRRGVDRGRRRHRANIVGSSARGSAASGARERHTGADRRQGDGLRAVDGRHRRAGAGAPTIDATRIAAARPTRRILADRGRGRWDRRLRHDADRGDRRRRLRRQRQRVSRAVVAKPRPRVLIAKRTHRRGRSTAS